MAALVIERIHTPEDAEAVLRIDRETFGDCVLTLQEILERSAGTAYETWLAREEGVPVGFICLMRVVTLHYKACWVDLVAVPPSCAGRGIAQALIRRAQQATVESGGEFLSALVRKDNAPSLRAFARQGFEAAGDGFDLMVWSGGTLEDA